MFRRFNSFQEPEMNVMLMCCFDGVSVMVVLGDRTLTEFRVDFLACRAQYRLTHCVSGALLTIDVNIAALKAVEVR